jgi:hypothetical protein
VDQVEVEVVQLELGERVVEGGFDVRRVVLRVPELGRDEDVLTLKARDVGKGALDSLGDFLLVFVAVVGGLIRGRWGWSDPTTEGQAGWVGGETYILARSWRKGVSWLSLMYRDGGVEVCS